MHLDKAWQDKDLKAILRTEATRKALRKEGSVPDSRKREIVLNIFELNPIMCETKWDMLIAIQGQEFVSFTKKAKRASEHLSFNILSEKGKHELEMILTILFKERGIKHSPTIANFACLLLIFMRPSEVFYTLSKMAETSEEALKNPELMMYMRWHFTYDKNQYLKCLEAFVKSYLNTTIRGKRSVLLHLQTINFDFYKLIDVCFRSLLGKFVPITIALDVMMAFLTQGMKGLFRYTYAIMKYHKDFIKLIGSGDEFLNILAKESKEKTESQKLQKYANKYLLKSIHYEMKKIDIEKIQDMKLSVEEYSNYIPN